MAATSVLPARSAPWTARGVPPVVAVVAVGAVIGILFFALPDTWFGGNTDDVLLTSSDVAACVVLLVVTLRSGRLALWWPVVGAMAFFSFAQGYLLVGQARGLGYLFPSWADLAFLLGNVLLFAGILRLVPGPRAGLRRAEVLDTLVITVSVGILFGVFAVLPAAGIDEPLPARLVSVAYPVIDIVLVHLLARTAGWPGRRPAGFWWLAAALLSTLAGDAGFAVVAAAGATSPPHWVMVLWLGFCTFLPAAAVSRSAPLGRRPGHDGAGAQHLRMPVLAVAALLPSGAVVVGQLTEAPNHVLVLTGGSVVVLLLVLFRVWTLLDVAREQAAAVARLADTDPLTGLANRRKWDTEVVLAFVQALESGAPVSVAIVDLDHFKAYNDTHGHDGGDDLLREAAQAWVRALPGAFVARWGGEEFTVLLRDCTLEDAVERLRLVHAAVPDAQTCSIGVATWDGAEVPPAVLARADEALYRAKRGGRNRTVVSGGRSEHVIAVLPEVG